MPTIFLTENGSKKKIKVENNLTLLEIAFNKNLDIEGSCGGEMACSTCHILIDPNWHPKLHSKIAFQNCIPKLQSNIAFKNCILFY